MNKQEWKNFKKNGIRHIFRCATTSWLINLYPNKLIDFISKHKFLTQRFDDYYKLRFFITKKPVIPILQYEITTHCTLNCKHCNTFVPYYSENTHLKIRTFEEYKKELDTLLKAVDYIYCFGFVGGEPLLSKDLAKMVRYACAQKKIKYVFIASNCTIIPDNELIQAMKHKKFGIQISDYRDVKNIKNGVTVKYDEIKKLLLDNNIRISNFQEKHERQTWQTMPEVYKDKQDCERVKTNFKRCYGQFCNVWHGGLITQCTLSLYITRNLELSDEIKDEIVDVNADISTQELTDKLIKFMSRPYSEFCHYCHWEKVVGGLPCGEQVE